MSDCRQALLALGKGQATNTDEFMEKLKTAFDPPSLFFLEYYVAIFFGNRPKKIPL